ncbi:MULTISPECIES: hypothetical protein [Fischerella]|uniref:hypothetical protein n=1 Tax=Fischerella TaxID=1190 RepID=UPI00031AC650|nr:MULTISPECIES: hypothetical protein [Fischerella]MBD2433822.1 hypothetical protein [Fischerella sp. FACHB-380]
MVVVETCHGTSLQWLVVSGYSSTPHTPHHPIAPNPHSLSVVGAPSSPSPHLPISPSPHLPISPSPHHKLLSTFHHTNGLQ